MVADLMTARSYCCLASFLLVFLQNTLEPNLRLMHLLSCCFFIYLKLSDLLYKEIFVVRQYGTLKHLMKEVLSLVQQTDGKAWAFYLIPLIMMIKETILT